MRLDLKAEARTDLRDIYEYGLARFGEEAVENYLAGMREAFGRLLDFPRSGQVYRGIEPAMRSVPYRRHRIFYRIEGDMLLIVRILHHAMDAAARLSQAPPT